MWSKKSKYSWPKAYGEIKNYHDEAFRAIDQAITLEEREKPKEAIDKYKEGITLIDQALNVQVQCPENPDITWEKACVMIQKVKKTRAEVLLRINSIQSSPNFSMEIEAESPPTYEEAMSSSEDEYPRTYRDLATALSELSVDPNQKLEEDIIYFYEGVRLYFISPNGEVLSTKEPQPLKISLVQGTQPNTPRAVLHIGAFVYPLVPGVSPCYRTNYGAFILPNLNAETPGSSIGIILPSDADDEVFDLLESILYGIISQPTGEAIAEWRSRREAEVSEDYSARISNKLVNGAWFLSQGIIKGATKAGEFFNTTTPKIISSIPRAEQPKEIPGGLTKTMQIAENTTNTAAKVTGFVADKIGTATIRLGRFLAPHIQKQGTKLLSTGFNMSEREASDKMKGILTVAAGAVEGFSTVYRGLETSAVILGSSLKDNTVRIVGHKYGQPASTLTDDTLSTVGNVYNIAQNTQIMTPRGLAKKTAKDTGKAMVYEYTSSYKGRMAYEQMIANGANGVPGTSSQLDNEHIKENGDKKHEKS